MRPCRTGILHSPRGRADRWGRSPEGSACRAAAVPSCSVSAPRSRCSLRGDRAAPTSCRPLPPTRSSCERSASRRRRGARGPRADDGAAGHLRLRRGRRLPDGVDDRRRAAPRARAHPRARRRGRVARRRQRRRAAVAGRRVVPGLRLAVDGPGARGRTPVEGRGRLGSRLLRAHHPRPHRQPVGAVDRDAGRVGREARRAGAAPVRSRRPDLRLEDADDGGEGPLFDDRRVGRRAVDRGRRAARRKGRVVVPPRRRVGRRPVRSLVADPREGATAAPGYDAHGHVVDQRR